MFQPVLRQLQYVFSIKRNSKTLPDMLINFYYYNLHTRRTFNKININKSLPITKLNSIIIFMVLHSTPKLYVTKIDP